MDRQDFKVEKVLNNSDRQARKTLAFKLALQQVNQARNRNVNRNPLHSCVIANPEENMAFDP